SRVRRCKTDGAGRVTTDVHIRAARPSWRAWIAAVAAAPVVALAPSPAAAGPPTGNPCDLAPLPQCAAAIGPLRDITARWRDDAPASIQVVPIWDYATDPEDGPPPGAGVCGSETGKPAADGSTVAPGQVVSTPPAGIPPPPGDRPPPGTAPTYCLLHYFAGP